MIKKLIFFLSFAIISTSLFSQEKEGLMVEMNTNFGDIRILLYNSTPLHQANFLKLVKEGFYNDQLFHRVVSNFMIQTGDPNSKDAAQGEMLGMGGPGYTIPAEFRENLFHKKGALAAARKGDAVNPKKESSGSQFYIVQGQVYIPQQLNSFVKMGKHKIFTEEQIQVYTQLGGTPHLDDSYTVFGEVISGLEVVDIIAEQAVNAYKRPLEDISFQIKIVK